MNPRNPFGLHTVTPYLVIDDVRSVIAFAQSVLGASLRGDLKTREDGSVTVGSDPRDVVRVRG